MGQYILRRLLQTIPVLLAVIILSFFLLHLAPGDPVMILAGEGASEEQMERVRKEFGLDKALYEQLGIYIKNTFMGNLGFSFAYQEPVVTLILERVPATVLLVGTALLIAMIIGVIIGVVSAKRKNSMSDSIITFGALLGYSIPVFWLGQLLVLVFSIYMPLFPPSGLLSLRTRLSGLPLVLDILWHLALPSLTLSWVYMAGFTRLTRASMLEIIGQNFIITARGKGVKERVVFFKHALRNALLPVVTYAGIYFGLMIGGVIVTETIFGWPGLGRLMYDSIFTRDYPIVMGMFVFLTITVILAQLATDLFYALLDPRIAYE